MLALAAGVTGAVMGMLLARRVALTHALQPRDRVADTNPARRPISAHDELGEDGLEALDEGFGKARPRTAAPQKRRALAFAEESTKSEFLNAVPLPGEDAEYEEAGDALDADALDLGDFAGPGDDIDGQEIAMTDLTPPVLPEDSVDEENVAFATKANVRNSGR